MTRETVLIETEAARATSSIVTGIPALLPRSWRHD
jgi:hypothetical protein